MPPIHWNGYGIICRSERIDLGNDVERSTSEEGQPEEPTACASRYSLAPCNRRLDFPSGMYREQYVL